MEQFSGVSTLVDVDSYVLLAQKINERRSTKFHPRLKGPRWDANILGDKYLCKKLVPDFEMKLREFHYNDRFVDLCDMTLRKVEEYYVDRILAYDESSTKFN